MTAKIGKLWQTFDEKYAVIGGIESQRKGRIAAYQAAVSNSETERAVQQLADSLKWRLNQW
ncbi:MAG: hypothetical protein LBT46_02480, partial [Planctomycetaceae bacterium]|nr:hypothetical protein [Planctomycetaceae bacterium]